MRGDLASARGALAEILVDNRSGAAELATRGGRVLLALLEEGVEEALAAGSSLVAAHPAMAPILKLVDILTRAVSGVSDPLLQRERGQEAIGRFLVDLAGGAERIKGYALALLAGAKRVMTHSYSSTVLSVLGASGLEVITPEARPMCEGVRMARELAKRGVKVRLVADFVALSLVASCDLVMVGGDAVTPAGVINKAGTYGIALAAREGGVPCYCLAGKEKFLPRSLPEALEEIKDPRELLGEEIPGVVVENRYFDLTPHGLIAGVVTQDGVIRGVELQRVLKEG